MSVWALRPTQSSTEWVPGAHLADIQQLEHEANLRAEDDSEWSCTLICLDGMYSDNIMLLYFTSLLPVNWCVRQLSDMYGVITIY